MHTRQLRVDEGSALQALAGQLTGILTLPQYGASTAGSQARSIPTVLQRRRLPAPLRTHTTYQLELYEEQRDALSYHSGPTGRDAVSAARLDFLSVP